MDIFNTIVSSTGSIAGAILAFVAVLSVVVFIHEMGHFLVARAFNVKIETFSIGFGPEIFGWNDSKGTRWKVSWLPLGGYVKFFGDEGPASIPSEERIAEAEAKGEHDKLFHFKPLYQRTLIVAAGPVANFILAIFIFATIIGIFGEPKVDPRVGAVLPGEAGEAAGFQKGDLVLSVDGTPVDDFNDIVVIVAQSPDRPLRFEIERAGERKTLVATPRREELTLNFGLKAEGGRLGLQSDEGVHFVYHDPLSAIWAGANRVWFVFDQTFSFLGQLVVGQADTSQMRGPLGIAEVSGKVASAGILPLLQLVAVLSASIGLINLFPIPMLDGGHLLYYGFEAVRGKPLGERAQELGFRIGLALVLFLMVFATWNDLARMGNF